MNPYNLQQSFYPVGGYHCVGDILIFLPILLFFLAQSLYFCSVNGLLNIVDEVTSSLEVAYPDEQVHYPDDQLRSMLKHQLEYYFSRFVNTEFKQKYILMV